MLEGVRFVTNNNLLGVIVAQSQFEDTVGTQLLQPFIHVDSHLVVVLIGLVSQAKDLKYRKRDGLLFS